jgi:hypothetical protein
MRKFAGVCLAAAMLLPVGLIATAPAGAAAVKGATCTKLTGTATLKPGLSNTTTKNKPAITIKNAKLSGCTGGVKTGTLSANLKYGIAQNCVGQVQGTSSGITGTAKVTWNDKSTSTLTLKLVGVTKKPTETTIPGKVTVGNFKGSVSSGTINYTLGKGQCGAKPFTSATFKNVTKIVI